MKLPPLTALCYFTAAASHNSFKAAALHFNVTEGAVSRQVKLLEQFYQQPLFKRAGRGVQLTEAGARLSSVSSHSLQQISQVSEQLLGHQSALTIAVTTSFAIRWLMPQLSEFEQLHSDVQLNIQATKQPDHSQAAFDAAIVYQLGNPFGDTVAQPAHSQLLMAEWLIPVCTPNMLPNGQPIDLAQLDQFRLIFNEATGRDWRNWLQVVHGVKAKLDNALRFEHDDTAIQAAVAGHGIALANLAYIENELKMGSLVAAVKQPPLPIGAHYLIQQPSQPQTDQLITFTDWLQSKAQQPSPTAHYQ